MQLHRFTFERSMLSVAFICFLLFATPLFSIQNQLDAGGYFVNDIVKWFSVFRVEFSMKKKRKKKNLYRLKDHTTAKYTQLTLNKKGGWKGTIDN